ncbi:MAG: hypothetical protein COY40_04100 [Alphaproteobacteria bacterium CG_4_10_14_0_8_um_filter_53_9]|nr:MAG: hypothetical protein COY40_04100 [Alphaproteobacteria bacterium CG_4_10_14_0_8_um_filter_53_9]
MSLLLTTSRHIVYEAPASGDLEVMYVSPSDTRQVMKHLQGNETRQEMAARTGMVDQIPLWRYTNGEVVLFGTLVKSLSERVQGAKVWLAEDYTDKEDTVFYYVLGGRHIVHGVKEQGDEAHVDDWRVTILKAENDEGVARLIKSSLNDQLMLSEHCHPQIAVHNNVPLLEKLNAELEDVGQKAVPFSALKPRLGLRPLYAQRNNSLLLITLFFIMFMGMMGAVVYALLGYMQVRQVEGDIRDLRGQISRIEINKHIGYIREPQQVLEEIKTKLDQQPSAVIDAGARLGALFGELNRVVFRLPGAEDTRANNAASSEGLEEGQYKVSVFLSSADQEMLTAQETMAKKLVEHMPWVRVLKNVSTPGNSQVEFDVVMQAEEVVR